MFDPGLVRELKYNLIASDFTVNSFVLKGYTVIKLRVCTKKKTFSFLIQSICCECSKEPSQSSQ